MFNNVTYAGAERAYPEKAQSDIDHTGSYGRTHRLEIESDEFASLMTLITSRLSSVPAM
jgi:hypothetical protein